MAGKTGVRVNGNEHRCGLSESKSSPLSFREEVNALSERQREIKLRVTHLDAMGLIILKGKLMTTYQNHDPYICLCSGKKLTS